MFTNILFLNYKDLLKVRNINKEIKIYEVKIYLKLYTSEGGITHQTPGMTLPLWPFLVQSAYF